MPSHVDVTHNLVLKIGPGLRNWTSLRRSLHPSMLTVGELNAQQGYAGGLGGGAR